MPMSLEEVQLSQLSKENEFVGLLYDHINRLITPQGLSFENFSQVLSREVPCNLSEYCEMDRCNNLQMIQDQQQSGQAI